MPTLSTLPHAKIRYLFEERNSFDMRRFVLSALARTKTDFRINFSLLPLLISFSMNHVSSSLQCAMRTHSNPNGTNNNKSTKQLINWKKRRANFSFIDFIFKDPHHLGFHFWFETEFYCHFDQKKVRNGVNETFYFKMHRHCLSSNAKVLFLNASMRLCSLNN